MALYRRIALNATRAQVWDAIATGPGLSAWFVRYELEPRKGGLARGDFGGGTFSESRVLAYEPGRRIVLGGERVAHDVGAEPEEHTDSLLEFWITSGDDRLKRRSHTVLHFRQRGFPEEDQSVYEAGWTVYFHTLAEYFNHFGAKPAVTTIALVLPPLDREEAFASVVRGLGVDSGFDVGDKMQITPDGQETITGVVDLRMSGPPLEALGIRTDTGFLRATSNEACGVMLNRYTYVVDPAPLMARNREENASWQGWLEQQLQRVSFAPREMEAAG